MMSAPAAQRSSMFCAICARPPPAAAKNSSAPGARSWTISSMAVPSVPWLLPPQDNGNEPPSCPGKTVTRAGTSPVACWLASISTPSEITPMPMPLPSTLCVWRATFAWWATSPSVVSTLLVATTTLPATDRSSTWFVIGRSAGRMDWTSSSVARGSKAASGSRARMFRYLGTLLTTVPPKALMRARTAGVTSARMSTVTSP